MILLRLALMLLSRADLVDGFVSAPLVSICRRLVA